MLTDRTRYAPLFLMEYDHKPGHYALILSDDHMVTHEALFERQDREANGYGWTDTVLGVVREQAPDLLDRLDFDPEAGTFCAYGSDREALEQLGQIVHRLFHDAALLERAVAAAPFEYD